MATFTKFIDGRNIEMEAQYIGTSQDDRMFEWLVTVKIGNKQERFDYSMGLAHMTFKRQRFDQKDDWKKNGWKVSTIPQLGRFGMWKPNKPDLEDVLYSLQSDYRCSADYSIGEFIDELGYTGAEGERVYYACKASEKKISSLFGGFLSEFLELEEDY